MNDLTGLNDQAWPTIAAVAATLAGFSIAAFAIMLTRSEMVVAADVATRTGRREGSSIQAAKFLLFDLLMYALVLLWSFLHFGVEPTDVAKGAVVVAAFLFVVGGLILLWKCQYGYLTDFAVTSFRDERRSRLDQAKGSSLPLERKVPRRPKGWFLIGLVFSTILLLWIGSMIILDTLSNGSMQWIAGNHPWIGSSSSVWILIMIPVLSILLFTSFRGWVLFGLFKPDAILYKWDSNRPKVCSVLFMEIQAKEQSVRTELNRLELIVRQLRGLPSTLIDELAMETLDPALDHEGVIIRIERDFASKKERYAELLEKSDRVLRRVGVLAGIEQGVGPDSEITVEHLKGIVPILSEPACNVKLNGKELRDQKNHMLTFAALHSLLHGIEMHRDGLQQAEHELKSQIAQYRRLIVYHHRQTANGDRPDVVAVAPKQRKGHWFLPW